MNEPEPNPPLATQIPPTVDGRRPTGRHHGVRVITETSRPATIHSDGNVGVIQSHDHAVLKITQATPKPTPDARLMAKAAATSRATVVLPAPDAP